MKIAKNRKHSIKLTSDKLRELMNYDQITGLFSWNARRCGIRHNAAPGRLSNTGYWRIRVFHENHLAHRLAWLYTTGMWPEHHMDHIDGNRTNNRFNNLRECTPSQNHQNKRVMSNSKTGLKGSWFDKSRNKYKSAISISGTQVTIGYFDTPEEAHTAYSEASIEHYGRFARAQ